MAVLDRVAQQIDDHLLETEIIPRHLHGFRRVAVDDDAFFIGQEHHLIGGGDDQFGQIYGGDVDHRLAGFES